MKKHLVIAPLTLALMISVTACAATEATPSAPSAEASSADQANTLTGAWRMTSLEGGGPDAFAEVPYGGQIDFHSRTVSVQAMNPDTTAPDSAYTVQGYEAFYGDLSIDEEAGTFSVEVESALARALIGQTLTRNYEVTDDTLVLTPIDESEGWRVTYEREAD